MLFELMGDSVRTTSDGVTRDYCMPCLTTTFGRQPTVTVDTSLDTAYYNRNPSSPRTAPFSERTGYAGRGLNGGEVACEGRHRVALHVTTSCLIPTFRLGKTTLKTRTAAEHLRVPK